MLYTGPLFIALLSALFLKEPITLGHWLAVGLGFLGVLLVVQPSSADFSWPALIPVLAAFLYASAAVLTRAKCADEAPASLAVNLNTALILCGTVVFLALWLFPMPDASAYPFLLGTWAPLDATRVGLLCILAVLIVFFTMGLARAYQSPRTQVIATFDYSYLIFAAFGATCFLAKSQSPQR